MVLANMLKKRYREEGREEGREEVNADWEAWYGRWRQAARVGEAFDEPPPTRNGRRHRDRDTAAPPSA